jgi:DNA-binding LacI/PurR family transcriptional regulator
LQRCKIRHSSPRRLLPDLVVLKKKYIFAKGEIRMENESIHSGKSSKSTRVTLKTVADHVGLTPGTISAVLNDTPGAVRIPQATRERIVAAARELNYRPNPLARALRSGQTIARSQFDSRNMSGALVIMDAGNFMLAMNAIQQAGLRVPDDVSVVEFDGTQASMGYTA